MTSNTTAKDKYNHSMLCPLKKLVGLTPSKSRKRYHPKKHTKNYNEKSEKLQANLSEILTLKIEIFLRGLPILTNINPRNEIGVLFQFINCQLNCTITTTACWKNC